MNIRLQNSDELIAYLDFRKMSSSDSLEKKTQAERKRLEVGKENILVEEEEEVVVEDAEEGKEEVEGEEEGREKRDLRVLQHLKAVGGREKRRGSASFTGLGYLSY